MFSKRTVGFLVVLIALVACTTAPTFAATGRYNLEIYGGYLVPGEDKLDDDITYGIRFGGRPADQWGWQVGFGYYDLQAPVNKQVANVVSDAREYPIDFTAQWFPRGGNFVLFGGVGWASGKVSIKGKGNDITDDAFTWNYGLGYNFNVTDQIYLKPEIKWRNIDGDSYSNTDTEYNFVFGWKF